MAAFSKRDEMFYMVFRHLKAFGHNRAKFLFRLMVCINLACLQKLREVNIVFTL